VLPFTWRSKYPYDIPAGTRIPRWAFINVMSLPGGKYSDAAAMQVGRDPEATPEPTTTSSMGNGRGTSNLKSKTRIIVGGVVGGVVALIILAAFVVLILRRRRKSRVPPDVQEKSDDHMEHPPPSPTLTPTSTNIRHFAYHGIPEPQTQGSYR